MEVLLTVSSAIEKMVDAIPDAVREFYFLWSLELRFLFQLLYLMILIKLLPHVGDMFLLIVAKGTRQARQVRGNFFNIATAIRNSINEYRRRKAREEEGKLASETINTKGEPNLA